MRNILKELNTNIIRWYKFKPNASILVIGEEVQEICDFLIQNYIVKKITTNNISIENYDNCNNKLNEKFDYIIIKDKISYLEKAKEFLKQDGTILLFMNNRWGVTYFAGSDGFKTLFGNENSLLNKDEIEKKIKHFGFKDYKFFYPLPNYEYANTIYSDEYIPKFTDSKLANTNIYLNDNELIFDENELLKNFTKNGDFTKFTNSYLIEINPKSEEKAIFYNNSRKEEYRLITKIFNEKVEKELYNNKSISHLNKIGQNIEELVNHKFNVLDKIQNSKVISEFFNVPNMYQQISDKIESKNKEEIILMIEEYYGFLKESFKDDKVNEINKDFFGDLDITDLFVVKKAYIDLVFENIFLKGKDIFVYDQEWSIENCPLEFIIFRIINNIYIMNKNINELISEEDMLNKFNLIDKKDCFMMAEDKFQKNVTNSELTDIYNRAQNLQISLDDLVNAKKNAINIRLYTEENIKKEKYISELQKEESELDLYKEENIKKEKYIAELKKKESELNLYKEENLKKEKYIAELKKKESELGLYKEENLKKEKYILELQRELEKKKKSES